LISSLVSIIVSIAIGIIVYFHLKNSFSELLQISDAIEIQRYEQRFSSTSKDEIGKIGHSINSLLNNVSNMQREFLIQSQSLEEKVKESLEKFGLELPNHGLFCYPSKDDRTDRVAEWKAKTIVQLLKDTGFKKAKFYDDKPKWVKKVVTVVRTELPEVEFEGIRVY
jgi:methyl-accepting chemotaxis protein